MDLQDKLHIINMILTEIEEIERLYENDKITLAEYKSEHDILSKKLATISDMN